MAIELTVINGDGEKRVGVYPERQCFSENIRNGWTIACIQAEDMRVGDLTPMLAEVGIEQLVPIHAVRKIPDSSVLIFSKARVRRG